VRKEGAQLKRWIVKKLEDGEWKMVGIYNENFVEQIGAAVAGLTKQGFEMYKTIRVEELIEKEEKNDG
jgi:hypothetical protein